MAIRDVIGGLGGNPAMCRIADGLGGIEEKNWGLDWIFPTRFALGMTFTGWSGSHNEAAGTGLKFRGGRAEARPYIQKLEFFAFS